MPKEVEAYRVARDGDGPALVETAVMYVADAREAAQKFPTEWFLRREDAEKARSRA